MQKKAFAITIFFLLFIHQITLAQYSSSFIVQGDADKFYPVTFIDINWSNNKASEFDLGRADVHNDGAWRGSLIAKFRYHVSNWGHRSNFIDADIRQFNNNFIAVWRDGTSQNASSVIIVWLRGGGNTYYVNSTANVNPTVYDGVQHALPYQEINGPAHNALFQSGQEINTNGFTSSGSAYFAGSTNNYFLGNVGIGTTQPDQKLTVNGTIHASQVKVDTNIPTPDYVFNADYKLASLSEVQDYINKHHHLPEIPNAQQQQKEGIDLGEMNTRLLKKVEELTLYLIDENKKNKVQQQEINHLKRQVILLSKSKAKN
ncbi:tail fiber protein [Mucilaginibacter sp. RS28]|uniref:Tail fiber protein n=1 Tax=Mucilaginibacter straminoryzae TaxID=2932774 RepID=A0A9X1X956_9SPHI|nr:tail fiber protein [Mucilaginibacter straminoryzae]MCJ8212038.1 tail fiber protein [Mucilaginibacter straminoryzae]